MTSCPLGSGGFGSSGVVQTGVLGSMVPSFDLGKAASSQAPKQKLPHPPNGWPPFLPHHSAVGPLLVEVSAWIRGARAPIGRVLP